MNTTELKALADRLSALANCEANETADAMNAAALGLVELIAAHEDAQGEIRALRETKQNLRERVMALEDALLTAHDHIDMWALEISHCKDADRIRSALPALLEQKP